MSVEQIEQLTNQEDDPNKLTVEVLELEGVEIRLVGCDHAPSKMPEQDPWKGIEEQIESSSLVFVEYFPEELRRVLYENPIWGRVAQASSQTKGIETFFGKVTELCIKHEKQVAVADIANGPLYSIYHGTLRALPSTLMLGTREHVDPTLFKSILLAGALYASATNLLEIEGLGPFAKERKDLERYFVDMEDARRLFTARAIKQEAARKKEGSVLTYISPPAHISRVKWYLENENDFPTQVKSKFYALAAGLPRSTRIYKYSENYESWQLVSNVETRA